MLWSLCSDVPQSLTVPPCDFKGIDLTVWTTILAVIWLHAFSADTKDEWELLVGKSLSWIKVKA
ncbi:hypothetical protein chiPu_0033268, partial [Chiloscyllium punctatum]|nr:hypothetical protein [Chiloscyllium punctatum]